MKQYVIDELRPADYEKIKAYLDETYGSSSIDDIYWISMDPDMFTDVQMDHVECHPLCFAIDLDPNRLACELLLRTQNKVKCSCMCYATEEQRNWIIQFADAIFDNLKIMT